MFPKITRTYKPSRQHNDLQERLCESKMFGGILHLKRPYIVIENSLVITLLKISIMEKEHYNTIRTERNNETAGSI